METTSQAKDFFFWIQGGFLVLVIFIFLRWNSQRDRSSQFGFREADRDRSKRGAAASHAQLNGPAHESQNAQAEKPKPMQLEGIRIDGSAHEILGIAADASRSEIQRAYRDRMKQYHPDLVGPPGSREWKDAQKIAEAINRAKEEMLKRTRL